MKARWSIRCVGLALGLFVAPLTAQAASSAQEVVEVGKKPFIDKDGDGIRDGEEDRFRSRQRRREHEKKGDTQRQRRERNRKGSGR